MKDGRWTRTLLPGSVTYDQFEKLLGPLYTKFGNLLMHYTAEADLSVRGGQYCVTADLGDGRRAVAWGNTEREAINNAVDLLENPPVATA